MATIKKFEDIEAWKEARKLCDKIGKIIDEDRFKKNFRLLNQIEVRLVLSWITLLKDLKEEQEQNLFSS